MSAKDLSFCDHTHTIEFKIVEKYIQMYTSGEKELKETPIYDQSQGTGKM